MDYRYADIIAELQKEFGWAGCCVRPKESSWLMRVIYYALLMPLWNKQFLTNYTTVLLFWVWMPTAIIGTYAGYKVLRHERRHMRDARNCGILPYALSYCFLLPIGPSMRAFWEWRGYLETMVVELEDFGEIRDSTLDLIVTQFTTSVYLWMWPFRRQLRAALERARARLISARKSQA